MLSTNNEKVKNLIAMTATDIANRVSIKGKDLIGLGFISNSLNVVIKSMINKYYDQCLLSARNDNGNIEGIIEFKNSSWLRLIEASDIDMDNLSKFNLSPVNGEITDKIVDRVINEMLIFKKIVKEDLKAAITEANKYIQNINATDKSFDDVFRVNLYKLLDVYYTIEEKGWLTNDIVDKGSLPDTLDIIKPYVSDMIVIDNIVSDAEVALLLKDELQTIVGKDKLMKDVIDLLSSDTIETFERVVKNINLLDINVLVLAVIFIKNKLLVASDDLNFNIRNTFNGLLKIALERLSLLSRSYSTKLNANIILTNYVKKDGKYDLYGIYDNYVKALDNKFTLSRIVGGFIKSYSNVNVSEGVIYSCLVSMKSLEEDPGTEEVTTNYLKSLSIASRNDNLSKIKNYFLFSLTNHIDPEVLKLARGHDTNIVEKLINNIKISDTMDVEETMIKLFKQIYRYEEIGTFNILLNAVEEAKKIYGNLNIEELVGYAMVKLVVLYLVSQTNIR